MEIGKDFKDLQSYNSAMGRAVDEKLFFLDKLGLDTNFCIVDFGCADGTVLQEIERRVPSKEGFYRGFVGFDISETMIKLAKEKWSGQTYDVKFTSNWDEVQTVISLCKKKEIPIILLLSSVLHEVYSYGREQDIETFWQRINNCEADVVVFRDMMWSTAYRNWDVGYWADKIRYWHDKQTADFRLPEFEKKWGSINVPSNLVHYLLKYQWQVNWERENNEDYLPISLSQFLEKMETAYEPSYLEHYVLPYLQRKVAQDWCIDLDIPTHLKAIFRRKY